MSAKSLSHAYGEGAVAVRYGLEESVFLDTIMFWWRTNRGENRNFRDGRWWTYNSLSTYRDIFPWWSTRQLRRIITSCKEKGAILIGIYNEDGRDRTHWYTPSDELLEVYGETDKCICQDGQMQGSEEADSFDGSDKSIKGNSASTSVDTTPLNPPTGKDEDPESPKKGKKKPNKLKLDDESRAILRDYVNENPRLGQDLVALMEVRAAKKAINSPRAVKTLLGELDRLSQGDSEVKLLLIRQSVSNSWKSVFPLKGGPAPNRDCEYWDEMAQRRRDEA